MARGLRDAAKGTIPPYSVRWTWWMRDVLNNPLSHGLTSTYFLLFPKVMLNLIIGKFKPSFGNKLMVAGAAQSSLLPRAEDRIGNVIITKMSWSQVPCHSSTAPEWLFALIHRRTLLCRWHDGILTAHWWHRFSSLGWPQRRGIQWLPVDENVLVFTDVLCIRIIVKKTSPMMQCIRKTSTSYSITSNEWD